MDGKKTARQLEAQKNILVNKANRLLLEGKLSDDLKKQIEDQIKKIDRAIGERAELERISSAKKTVKNVTEHIDTKTPYLKEIKGGDFTEKIQGLTGKNKPTKYGAAMKMAGKSGKKVRSMIPGLGLGLAAMNIFSAPSAEAGEVAMEEAQQAVTDVVPGGVEALGPAKGSPEAIIEDPSASPEMRRKAIELLRKKNNME